MSRRGRPVGSDAERDVEAWLIDQGLPYFVHSVRRRVRRGLTLKWLVLGAALVAGAAAATITWQVTGDAWSSSTVLSQVVAVIVLVYAFTMLSGWAIATWAAKRSVASIGLLFPLAARALPLLLLFVTFLFINAEVWQVSANLTWTTLWWTVALFSAITVGFLLVRLPDELDTISKGLEVDQVVSASARTPLAATARRQAEAGVLRAGEPIAGVERANLVLVLLIAQLVQVLLLTAVVFAFFVVFGLLIMEPSVVRAWTQLDRIHGIPGFARANVELLKVSLFLAGFSGLHFTVYAVTDSEYRRQFFDQIIGELERAVSVRIIYRSMRAGGPGPA